MSRYVSLDFDPVVEAADLPEGTYKVMVLEANEKTATTGSQMIELVMDVIDDPQHSGRRLFDNIVLSKKTAWKLMQVARGFGLDVHNIDLDKWLGCTAWVDVTLEKDTGRARPSRYRAS